MVGKHGAQKKLLEATEELISAETNQQAAEIAVEVATEVLEMSYTGVHLYEERQDALVPIAWSDSVEEVLDNPPALGDGSLAWEVYERNTFRVFEDLQTVEGTQNPDTPFRSEIIVPLGEHGVFLVAFVDADSVDETRRQLVRILGANVTAALDRIAKERSLRSFEQAIEHSGHAIVITDTEGSIEYVNPAFEDVTGYTAAEAIGRNPRILKSGEHGREFYEEMWDTIMGGEIWRNELINTRKDGERFIVDQTIAPVFDENGGIDRFVAVNNDITELKERERNLELLNQVVRHDIRNDLQLVQGTAELLEEHVTREGETHLETIQKRAMSAVELTRTARELADVILQTESENEPIPLDRTLREQVDALRSEHPDTAVSVDGSLPRTDVVANEMLESVFRNLLGNAIRHNDKDTPEVTVSARERNGNVEVRIADNGPGIPDEQKEVIFGKGEKRLRSDGTGIGLYLVQSLVDSYGGDVRVEDNDPEGAVFVVRLPAASP